MSVCTHMNIDYNLADGVKHVKNTTDDVTGDPIHVIKAAEFFSNNKYKYYQTGPLSKAELMQTLNSGRSVMAARYWYFLGTQRMGHIVVIYGYEFNRSEMVLKIRDSWPPESGATYVRTYEECLSGSDKYKWEKSIIRKP